MTGGACFSPCRKYRYRLERQLDGGTGRVTFVMLNPSTADETEDDPTIRRCIGFGRAWGYRTVDILNIFAWRSTDPHALAIAEDPVGPENNAWLLEAPFTSALIVAAWGTHGALHARGAVVRRLLEGRDGHKLHHLGLTAGGYPKHPLYLRGDLKPMVWT